MKFTKIFIIACCSAFISTAQTSTEPFSKIELSSIGKIFLQQGDSNSIVINTTGKREKISTQIKDGMLIINSSIDAEYHIMMKNIDGISVSGSGEVVGETPLKSDALTLDVSGSGKMTMQLAVKMLNIDISGVGKIVLNGTADNVHIGISGSGKVDALDLKVADCTANISGMGKCNIDVTENLSTNISGMGTINYKMPPKNVRQDISGVGKINDEKTIGEKNDTTRFKFGKSNVLIISGDSARYKRKHTSHSPSPIWQGIELGFNNYLNGSGGPEVPSAFDFLELNTGKSVSVALNFLQKNVQFGHSNFWFFTGLGITWNNYRFDKNVEIDATKLLDSRFDTTSGRSFQKSKLVASYITVPLMFEIFTSHKSKNAFHLGAGAVLGYRIGSHTKVKYEEEGHVFKPKTYDDFNLNPFRYGFRAAIGYNKFNVFGDYYASTLFKDGKGPVLYPINFGITLVGL